MHHVAFAMLCLLWGSNFILMKIADVSFGFISIAASRVTLGCLVVAIWWPLRRQPWPVRRRHWPHLVFVALCSYVYPFITQPYLIHETKSSAFIGMMVVLVPLATIIASVPMLGVRPSPRQLLGVLGGLICFGLVFYEGVTLRGLTFAQFMLAAGIPTGYAVANTYVRRFLSDVPALPLTLATLALATLVLLPLSLATESIEVTGRMSGSILAMLLMGLAGTGVATVIFYKLVHDHGPLFAGMVTYVIPIVALVLGATDRERLTGLQIGALLGILAMLAIVQVKPRPAKRERDAPAEA